MRGMSDNQRRAMFAKMNRAGASLSPVEIEFKPGSYSDIRVSGFKGVNEAPASGDVPDWVTSNQKPKEEVNATGGSSEDYLLQYANTTEPSYDTSIKIVGDKSDVAKGVDDFLAKYAENLPKEKRLVGAIKVSDDEYEISGPTKLRVRNKVKRELDDILNTA